MDSNPEDGPARHRISGTPTAGGIVFLVAAVVALLILTAGLRRTD